jgi:acetyltransferase-like isoleucine patch superfamily enzyme
MSPRTQLLGAADRWRALRVMRATIAAQTPPPPRRFAAFGVDSWIVPPARVEHPECIWVGADVVVHEHAWLAVCPRDDRPAPCLRLGDRARIQRFVNIVCHGTVSLGRGTLVGDRTFITDVDHGPLTDSQGRPAPLEPRPVIIGDAVFIGAGAVIGPGVTIGDFAYVSAASVVMEDVAEGTLVAGAPARAVRRWTP